MKIKTGDILEIRTSVGLAYAIFTHRDSDFGAMIRVFDQLHEDRPDDFVEVAKGNVRFTTFYPLQAAVNKKVVGVVGNVRVPDHLKAFPLFRAAGLISPTTSRVDNWWMWDGQKEWCIGALTDEHRKLPIRAVWNHTFLVDRIIQGWRPECDQR
jgi:hypothetical protein